MQGKRTRERSVYLVSRSWVDAAIAVLPWDRKLGQISAVQRGGRNGVLGESLALFRTERGKDLGFRRGSEAVFIQRFVLQLGSSLIHHTLK